MQIIRNYFSSILLILIAWPLFREAFPTESYFFSRCALGDPSFLLSLFLFTLGSLLILIIIAVTLYRGFRAQPINLRPYFTLVILFSAYYFLRATYPDILFGKQVLRANVHSSTINIEMSLTQRHYAKLSISKGMTGIVHFSKIRQNRDTIRLENDLNWAMEILQDSSELLSDRYYIDSVHHRIYPIHSTGLKDTTSYLKY